MTVAALNFKQFEKGAMRGFLDLRCHGMVIKGVRLMSGNNGLWLGLPQKQAQQDGETKWFDQMYLTPPEADHVLRLVLSDLQAQGHIQAPVKGNGGHGQQPHHGVHRSAQHGGDHRSPEGEDLSEHYTQGANADDILGGKHAKSKLRNDKKT